MQGIGGSGENDERIKRRPVGEYSGGEGIPPFLMLWPIAAVTAVRGFESRRSLFDCFQQK